MNPKSPAGLLPEAGHQNTRARSRACSAVNMGLAAGDGSGSFWGHAQGAAWAPARAASRRALNACSNMCWSALLLALCGQALCARALAAVEAPAPAPLEGLPTSADVLLPETDRDVVALLAHLMSAQHELVLAMHGPVRCWTWRMRATPGKASVPDAGARACRTRRWQRCPSRPPPRRSSSPTGFCNSRTTRPRLSTWRTTLCRTSLRPPMRCAAGRSPRSEPTLIAARSCANRGSPSAQPAGPPTGGGRA